MDLDILASQSIPTSTVTRGPVTATTSPGTPPEEGHLRGCSSTLPPLSDLQHPQDLRWPKTRYRLILPQLLHSRPIIQDDKPYHPCLFDNSPGVGSFLRFTGCLSPHPNPRQLTQISGLFTREQAVLLQSPPLRTQCGPSHLHLPTSPSTLPSAPGRSASSCLPRRLGHMGPISNPGTPERVTHPQASDPAGLPSKQQEVPPGTNHRTHLARGPLVPRGGPVGRDPFPEDQHMHSRPQASPLSIIDQKRMGILCGQTDFSGPNPQTSSPSHRASRATSTPISQLRPGHSEDSPQLSSVSATLLVQGLQCSPSTTIPRPFGKDQPLDGCLFGGLGGTHGQGTGTRRKMVSSRAGASYQRSGTPGGIKSPPRVLHLELPSLSHDRQRDSPQHNQQANHPLLDSTPASSGPGQSMPLPQNITLSIQDPLLTKHTGRRPEQDPPGTDGMDTPGRGISDNPPMARTAPGRPHGHKEQLPSTSLCIPSPTPGSVRDRRPTNKLGPVDSDILVPSQELPAPDSASPPEISSPRSHNSTLASFSPVVPLPDSAHDQTLTCPSTSFPNRSRRIHQQRLFRLRKMDRLQFLRHIYARKQGPTVARALVSAYRASSIRQAETAWRAFKTWLPTSLTKLRQKHVLQFLIHLREAKKLSPRTILGYRNSLSTPLKEAFNIDFNNPDFHLLARSQFLSSPPPQKQVPQWSLNHALESLQSPRFRSMNISLRDLFLKTLFLTALASGNRVSELAAITREDISLIGSEVKLKVHRGFLFKNQTLDRAPPAISFPRLSHVSHPFCPAAALQDYITATAGMNTPDRLFLHPTSGKSLSGGRLSYWLAVAISTLDTSGKGKAHDLRKVGHSLAYSRGISPTDILRNGFWGSPNVFITRYLVKTDNPGSRFIGGRHFINP